MKTVLITIQIDDIVLSDLEQIEEDIEKTLEAFPRKRITLNINKTFGSPIPIDE